MKTQVLNDGIILINGLEIDHKNLFKQVKTTTNWDESIKSRKTASYGVPYNYNQITYKKINFPVHIRELSNKIKKIVGFEPNNCLINFYEYKESKMGFHSDQIDILDSNTGIVIVSLGSSRIMRFKDKVDPNITFDVELMSDSLCYMTQDVQKKWLHSILSKGQDNESERISITFRRIK